MFITSRCPTLYVLVFILYIKGYDNTPKSLYSSIHIQIDMVKQKQINQMLNGIKSNKTVYNTYGKMITIPAKKILMVIIALPLATLWLSIFLPITPNEIKIEVSK